MEAYALIARKASGMSLSALRSARRGDKMRKGLKDLFQLDLLKAEMCDCRCRYFYEANNPKAKNRKEIKERARELEKHCENCPLGDL